MPTLAKSATPLGARLRGLLAGIHPDIAIVALANKLVPGTERTSARTTNGGRSPGSVNLPIVSQGCVFPKIATGRS
jgi:hypothetical protein